MKIVIGVITLPLWLPLAGILLVFTIMDICLFTLPYYAFTGEWVFGHRQMSEEIK